MLRSGHTTFATQFCQNLFEALHVVVSVCACCAATNHSITPAETRQCAIQHSLRTPLALEVSETRAAWSSNTNLPLLSPDVPRF
jgi:hypothetical protein